MSKADDPQFDFKKPEDNIKKWQPKKWENTGAFHRLLATVRFRPKL
jgi:hypothetical protein